MIARLSRSVSPKGGTHEPFDIADASLAEAGALRIEWAGAACRCWPRSASASSSEPPLAGIRIGACLHVTAETANLMRTLRAGGAEVTLCASNPLSTQDDVAAALVRRGHPGVRGAGRGCRAVLRPHPRRPGHRQPHVTMDDGADLVTTLLKERAGRDPLGSTEETTTGVHPPAGHGRGRRAALPGGGGERLGHQAPVRQPPRHRASRRSTASCGPPTCCFAGQDGGRDRLRRLRHRGRLPGRRPGRAR